MDLAGFLIAAALGIWAWSDAKTLARRGIRVGSFSPAVWGWLVALLAIVFGIMYLVQRPKALAAQTASGLPWRTPYEDSPEWSVAPQRALPSPSPEKGEDVAPGATLGEARLNGSPPVESDRTCVSCGTPLPTDARYCPHCAHPTAGDQSSRQS